MNSKNWTLLQESWDYLIVLDACRYDYFKRLWEDYLPLDGVLSCRTSAGSCTNEWRDNSFPDYYEDIVYITANPQINLSTHVYGYCAKDHFKHVHEIWKDNWNEIQGTVLPETVTQKAINIISQYTKEKRFIIHYIQPHAPYLSINYDKKNSLEMFTEAQMLSNPILREGTSKLKRTLFRLLKRLFQNSGFLTNQPEWILRKFLRIPPFLPMEIAWRKLGIQGLKKAYAANLIAVLPQIGKLIDSLAGTIVVTSDHGEFLGEKRRFGHPCGSDDPILQNIPWYLLKKADKKDVTETINKSTNANSTNSQSEEDKEQSDQMVVERLRALGYYE